MNGFVSVGAKLVISTLLVPFMLVRPEPEAVRGHHIDGAANGLKLLRFLRTAGRTLES